MKRRDTHQSPSYLPLFCFTWALAAMVFSGLAGIALPFLAGYVLAIASAVLVLIFGRKRVGQNSAVLLCVMLGAYAGSILADTWIAMMLRSWEGVKRDALLLLCIYIMAFVLIAMKRTLWECDVSRGE